ncbi:MAG TPA: hypothetical protein VF254_09735 [Gammaproteobacteria bacterium]
MNKKNTTYRVPEGFNPFATADTIRGLTDAVHRFLFEGPGTLRKIPGADRAALNGLAELLQAEVHALHDYLREIENRTTLELPRTDAEFDAMDVRFSRKDEVRETAAVYSIR